ncbi:Crp/Fnr family transcriptional regulator [Pedobacter hiemivivus]|uniref:Crp/Fnr family transcriptional regulator n=1 Tax=Pedobacter hiemivivus TaxID=2530454 RepID=A0A4R0NA89_9SPHI|nr:Crp/Fnr family transcriptional regulator [Pedobacter hiemivivus]TCC97149.1 Crp/Fnr family transcriptional regulator [Pedobacter hiemivivus]TKC59117.1 Crp/Fnr family transcriptional regulator [Pedobacter hiemivivus]
MHEQLIKYITAHSTTPLTAAEVEMIKEIFVPKHFRKREYLLQQNEICKYAAFIIKGAMRQYSVDDKGAEHITYLTLENWWAVDRESFTMLTPSNYYIDAWEPTDALLITKADSIKYMDTIPAMRELTQVLNEKNAFALLNRVNSNISLSAEQRYDRIQKTYPKYLQRFPLHIIASYLGITKETLSRIRSQQAKK